LMVRYKDDYRILCKSEKDCKETINCLQEALHEYCLQLNEDKTSIYQLPDGLFRTWRSKYHYVKIHNSKNIGFENFRELYLSVINIDRECPSTGVIDRFLNDIIVKKGYKPRFKFTKATGPKIIGLLLLLAELRNKAFPKILGIIESVLDNNQEKWIREVIGTHLGNYLEELSTNENRFRYLIIWILYFMKSNNLEKYIIKKHKYKDPIVKSIQSNRNHVFNECKDFKLFLGIKSARKQISMLRHLDVFEPQ